MLSLPDSRRFALPGKNCSSDFLRYISIRQRQQSQQQELPGPFDPRGSTLKGPAAGDALSGPAESCNERLVKEFSRDCSVCCN